jgi:hypothetical protein
MTKGVVRRVESGIAPGSIPHGDLRKADEYLPAVERRKDGLMVTSQKTLGVDPGVLLTWTVDPRYWGDGYRLLGFRSTTGFAPELHPKELAAHGQMILEETADGSLDEHPPEGTHFYTFVLHKPIWFGLREAMSVVRFSESIPSARTAIGRIEDQLKLQQLQEDHQLHGVRGQVAANEAAIALHRSQQKLANLLAPKPDDSLDAEVRREVEAIVRKKMKKAMSRVELLVALQEVQRELKRRPIWKKLSPDQRKKLLEDVVGDLDAEEEFFQP